MSETQNAEKTAAQAYHEKYLAALSLVAKLGPMIQADRKEFSRPANRKDWGYVGSMARVEELLDEAYGTLARLDQYGA